MKISRSLYLAVAAALSLCACAGPLPAIKSRAATDMTCEPAKLTLTQPKPNVNLFIVEGCDEIGRYYVPCNIAGYCGQVGGEVISKLIRKQASFDLQCDGAMTLQSLNADTYGVRGCGHQASYLLLCDGAGCKAVQNTQSQTH